MVDKFEVYDSTVEKILQDLEEFGNLDKALKLAKAMSLILPGLKISERIRVFGYIGDWCFSCGREIRSINGCNYCEIMWRE